MLHKSQSQFGVYSGISLASQGALRWTCPLRKTIWNRTLSGWDLTKVRKFQFCPVSIQISPEFLLCHFCTLQLKLKALSVLQDTMNIPYHISDSKWDRGVHKEKPIPLPLAQSHPVILSLHEVMVSSKRTTGRKQCKWNSVYPDTFLSLLITNTWGQEYLPHLSQSSGWCIRNSCLLTLSTRGWLQWYYT